MRDDRTFTTWLSRAASRGMILTIRTLHFLGKVAAFGVFASFPQIGCGKELDVQEPSHLRPGEEIAIERTKESGKRKMGEEWWEYEIITSIDHRFIAKRRWRSPEMLETIRCEDHKKDMVAVFFCDAKGLQQREYYSLDRSKTVMIEQFRFPDRTDLEYHNCVLGNCREWDLPRADPCTELVTADVSVIEKLCKKIQMEGGTGFAASSD